MKMMSIVSGSSGNCTLISTANTSILVDVGTSKKRINDSLHEIGMDMKDINGILITHEHIDHVRGLGVISRSYDIPVYATAATLEEIDSIRSLGEYDKACCRQIEPNEEFVIGDISVCSHSIWHDAADPVCYTFKRENKKISIATDMGGYDDYIINALSDSDIMLIEANHDIRMLEVGPYPYELKHRILGKYGHLSNESSGQLIKRLLNNHIKGILLGHLSKENNYPELAYETVKCELDGNCFSDDVRDFNLKVASRDSRSELIAV